MLGQCFVPLYHALGPILYVGFVVGFLLLIVGIGVWQDRHTERPNDDER